MLLFQKLNKMFLGYLNPEDDVLDDENRQFLG